MNTIFLLLEQPEQEQQLLDDLANAGWNVKTIDEKKLVPTRKKKWWLMSPK